MSDDATQAEVELLFALVRQRYGSRLTAERLEAVRTSLAAIVRDVATLRAVRLENAAEPLPSFVPFRGEP